MSAVADLFLVQAAFDRLGPVKEARAEMSARRQRLDQLEQTLANLEEGRAKKPTQSFLSPVVPGK